MSSPSVQRSSQRLTAILLLTGAVIGAVGNALHPHVAVTMTSKLQAIAGNEAWVAIHLAVLVAILLVIGGLVGLARLLDDGPGAPLARIGIAAALVGGALATVSTSIDGFAMRPLALDWAAASASDAATVLGLAGSVDVVGFAIWSMAILVLFGAAFACFGAALAQSGQFPAWLGWVAIVAGAGSAVTALLQIANDGEVQAAETIFFASSLLVTLWAFAVGVLVWRDGRAPDGVRAPGPLPVG
ncbi:MAG TPA: DUF4386 family protein [Candidatus Limnocylindrales bacterium]